MDKQKTRLEEVIAAFEVFQAENNVQIIAQLNYDTMGVLPQLAVIDLDAKPEALTGEQEVAEDTDKVSA